MMSVLPELPSLDLADGEPKLYIQKQKINVSWADYEKLANQLAQKILASQWTFDHIVCIARGGLLLGNLLSEGFKKPLAIISASSYRGTEGTEQSNLIISKQITMVADNLGKRVLLVDDLADSGITLRKIKDHLRNNYNEIEEIRTAVLWQKSCSTFSPDFAAERISGTTWINQPFENFKVEQ